MAFIRKRRCRPCHSSFPKKAYENRNSPYGLGDPFDNAVCECFFKYLKQEEKGRRTYRTFNELPLSVFEYIEEYYNSRRPHGSLGYLAPNEAESVYWGRK